MPLLFPAPVEQAIERIGGRRRAAIALVGVATVVLILGLSRWAAAPSYVPVYSDLELETVGKITAKLDEEGIAYRLESGGSELQVASTDLARVRVALASEGLPAKGRPGLELFDQPSWGMTDFTQRINYRRALEGELERTIGKMTGVESAQVHLAMDETRTFRSDDRPKSASVVLRLRSGEEPAADVVRGIQHLVASSVDGVESAAVAVLDDSGRMLSSPAEPGSLETLTSQQLGMQREVEGYLEGKAQQIVDQVLGPGAARVKVAAQINFDRVERTVQKLDPDAQAVQAEQKAEIIPGPQGGAGSTNTSTTYENSRSMESFTGATGNVKRLSVAVVVDDKRVPKGDTTVAVPRTPAELAQIQTLVRNAVGLDDSRGDAISVVGMSFSPPPLADPEPAPSVWVMVADYRSELLSALGLLIAAFVALRVLRSLKSLPAAPSLAPALAAGGVEPGALPGFVTREPTELEEALPVTAISPTSNRTRAQVVATVQERPDVAARLARAWLKEG